MRSTTSGPARSRSWAPALATPDLLTRRAAARLAAADVVFYDALVDPDVLELAGKAQRIYVGKRAGRPAIRQTLINQLLVRAARRGQRVVRLKGGDPFVFGRGGEEALALVAAGIPFEVVPGITLGARRAGSRRHSGHPSRQRRRVRRRLGSRAGGLRAGARHRSRRTRPPSSC